MQAPRIQEHAAQLTSASAPANDDSGAAPTTSTSSPATSTSEDLDEILRRRLLEEFSAPPVSPKARKVLLTIVLLPIALLVFLVLLVIPTIVPGVTMADILSFLKSLLLPALIAALLYALLTYVLLPLYRRHRARYSQYLPLSSPSALTNLSTSTSSLRQRAQDALLSFLLPSRWAEWRYRTRSGRSRVVDASDGDERVRDEEMGVFDSESESGESDLEGLGLPRDSVTERRRDAYERGASRRASVNMSGNGNGSDRRLSRELEEGFRDSSDEEDEDEEEAHVRR